MGGRGRGVAAFSFNVEALGITRGSMPEAMVGPRPLFPVSTDHSHYTLHQLHVWRLLVNYDKVWANVFLYQTY